MSDFSEATYEIFRPYLTDDFYDDIAAKQEMIDVPLYGVLDLWTSFVDGDLFGALVHPEIILAWSRLFEFLMPRSCAHSVMDVFFLNIEQDTIAAFFTAHWARMNYGRVTLDLEPRPGPCFELTDEQTELLDDSPLALEYDDERACCYRWDPHELPGADDHALIAFTSPTMLSARLRVAGYELTFSWEGTGSLTSMLEFLRIVMAIYYLTALRFRHLGVVREQALAWWNQEEPRNDIDWEDVAVPFRSFEQVWLRYSDIPGHRLDDTGYTPLYRYLDEEQLQRDEYFGWYYEDGEEDNDDDWPGDENDDGEDADMYEASGAWELVHQRDSDEEREMPPLVDMSGNIVSSSSDSETM
jgi:hypothetical protein